MDEAASIPKITRGRVADQILADLRRRILSGELADGSKLPAERDLAVAYGVSGATVREAVRVLSATGLVDVRHGSGSYVRANADTLIATLLASVVEVERTGLFDLLDVAQALNARGAQLAAERATAEELASLRHVAGEVPEGSVGDVIGGLKRFFTTLWVAAHSPLLTTLAKVLMDIQLGIALELSEGRLDRWQLAARELADKRVTLVDALEARDPERAAALVAEYHAHLVSIIDSLLNAAESKVDDPELAALLSSFVAARVGDPQP
ncbi:GntR family transcriptional regulator [Nonomuraea sp. NPDC005983]|uniref:FadR/GntR family transcriptional regulator n=1 Tax=Nonomuraea sp. NPDC005983 TaxID=3155595 RepID=UPI0033B510E3